MKRILSASVAAFALLLGTQAAARADSSTPDNVAWTYNFTPNLTGVLNGQAAVLADGNPSAGVTFTDEPLGHGTGTNPLGTDVVMSNLKLISSATGTSTDSLSTNGAYKVTLTLGYKDAGGTSYSGQMVFTGKLTGTFASGSSNLTNTFTGLTTQNVTVGNYNFNVTLFNPTSGLPYFTPPGPPDQHNSGSIGAHITVSSNVSPSGNAPEPGTMLLSGLGLSLVGGAALRKRRQARAAA